MFLSYLFGSRGYVSAFPYPYLDVEPFFDEVIMRAGGYRVDSLVPANRTFENATTRIEGVFAELKVLQYDAHEDERLKTRLAKVYMDFAKTGKVHSLLSPNEEDLPAPACYLWTPNWRYVRPLKRKIDFNRPLKKAAKQLERKLNGPSGRKRENDFGLLETKEAPCFDPHGFFSLTSFLSGRIH